MLDDRNNTASLDNEETKKLYMQQLVEEDLEEADEMINLFQNKKRRRTEEKLLKKMLMSRTMRGGKSTIEDSIKAMTENTTVDTWEDGREVGAFVFERTSTMTASTEVSKQFLKDADRDEFSNICAVSSASADFQFNNSLGLNHSSYAKNIKPNFVGFKEKSLGAYKPSFLEKSQANMDKLQEFQTTSSAKRSATFNTIKKKI